MMKIAGLDLSISSSGIIVEELDDNLEITNVQRYGFTKVLKNAFENIIYYKVANFKNDYERYQFFCDNIVKFCDGCEYVAVEDYAYSMSGASGMIFSLAEFEGNIKMELFRRGCRLRFYTPNQNKKFFAGYGSADKIGMMQAFEKWPGKKPNLVDLPAVTNGKAGNSPTSDIIDAFAICEFLRKELKIRNNLEKMEEQEKYIQECFLTKTKEHPTGLINSDFIYK